VIVVPVRFVADHLETLYDVDIRAREQAERCGLAFRRVESLNADRVSSSARSGSTRIGGGESAARQAGDSASVRTRCRRIRLTLVEEVEMAIALLEENPVMTPSCTTK
jgi:hypothetical protein